MKRMLKTALIALLCLGTVTQQTAMGMNFKKLFKPIMKTTGLIVGGVSMFRLGEYNGYRDGYNTGHSDCGRGRAILALDPDIITARLSYTNDYDLPPSCREAFKKCALLLGRLIPSPISWVKQQNSARDKLS